MNHDVGLVGGGGLEVVLVEVLVGVDVGVGVGVLVEVGVDVGDEVPEPQDTVKLT